MVCGEFGVYRVSGKSFSETEQWNGPGNTTRYSIPCRLMFSCRCTPFELRLLVTAHPSLSASQGCGVTGTEQD